MDTGGRKSDSGEETEIGGNTEHFELRRQTLHSPLCVGLIQDYKGSALAPSESAEKNFCLAIEDPCP